MKTLSSVRKNTYYDSVTLMGLSKRLNDLPGIVSVSVSMGTDMNKQILVDGGFDASSIGDAGPNDLMIACGYEDFASEDEILESLEAALKKQIAPKSHDSERPRTLTRAAEDTDANIAVISVPGAYAAAEARKALEKGLHVLMFSDNVTIEDEIALKELAHSKGLLMMGPDCGTCAFQGVAFCFANDVRRGGIGIVSASGTGAQEAAVLLDAAEMGVSQIIGTGGRDLSIEVGGRMFLDAFDALDADEGTSHILLISKPPHESVAQKIRERVMRSSKPVVACFLGDASGDDSANAIFKGDIASAVDAMVHLVDPSFVTPEVAVPVLERIPDGAYVRGLFCGGTLMEEAKMSFSASLPDASIYSNSAKGGSLLLDDVAISQGHTFLDLGDDAFTRGKPHPMIDPQIRNARIMQEAADVQTAVILLDFVLGYGAHEDPVGAALSSIHKANVACLEAGRTVVFVAYVLGTETDPQDKRHQEELLEQEGVLVCQSNVQAAKLAASIVKELK